MTKLDSILKSRDTTLLTKVHVVQAMVFPVVMYKLSTEELMLFNCGVGKDSWESLGLQGDPTSQSSRKSVLNIHWKDWCWNWSSNTLAAWCEKLTHWKRLWFWERLKVGGEGDDRGWDGWMASLSQWMHLSRLREMVKDREGWRAAAHGVARVGHDWAEQQQ